MMVWKEFELSELTSKIGSGATPRGGQEAYKFEGISLIRSQNVLDFSFSYKGLAFIDDEQAYGLRNVIIEKDDILINITGDSVARVTKVPFEVIPARVNQHVAILRTDRNKLDSNFLLYYLLNPVFKKYLLRIASDGATRNALTKSNLEDLIIKAPQKIEEQKAIAKVLIAFDDKIELLQKQNKTLQTIAQTIFKEWFGKYQLDDELPEGFEIVTLKEIIESANTGLDAIKRAPIVLEETGVKCFRIQDASQKKKFDDWGNTKVEEKNYKRFKLLKGDILIARTGNTIGVNYLVKEDLKSVFNNGIIRLRTNSKSNYSFLYNLIISRSFEKHIQAIAYGTSTQPNMQINSLLSYEFLLPPQSKQKSFENVVKPIIEKQRINLTQIQSLTKTRDMLLPKLMSGQVRVKNTEK